MARTYREIAIEEMLRTVEEAMTHVIDWWGDLPAPMKEAIEQFRTQLGAAIDSVDTHGDRWRVPMPPRHCCERPLRGHSATELVRTAHRFISRSPESRTQTQSYDVP